MTVRDFDEWLILTLSIWFIPKGILFFATWWISRKLTPEEFRSELGDAYRGIFLSLGFFSMILAAIFFLRWIDDRPVIQTGPWEVIVGLRIALVIVMAIVTWQEIRAMRALWKRYRAGQHITRDPDTLVESDLERCLRETARHEDTGGRRGDI